MPTSPEKQEQQREKQEKTKEAKKADIDDVIPKIKSSHLNLDDVPVELLKTHQEKILKQVSFYSHCTSTYVV